MKNYSQRIELLSHLAQNSEDNHVITRALEKEALNIHNALKTEHSYQTLDENLNLLNVICHRVPQQTITMLKEFLVRLETLIPTSESDYLSKYCTADKLIISVLKLLSNLRYFKTVFDEIANIFLNYSVSENEDIKKQALENIYLLTKYDIDVYNQIGFVPQKNFLQKLINLSDEEQKKYFYAIINSCRNILSVEMEATATDYQTITFKRADVPFGNAELQKLRNNCRDLLKNLYPIVKSLSEKKALLYTLDNLRRTPPYPKLTKEEFEFHKQDIHFVLNWFQEIITNEQDMLILQTVEKEAYWALYHSPLDSDKKYDKEIFRKALEIRDFLYNHPEYKIFRILIGYEAVFKDWENREDNYDYKKREELRKTELEELVNSVKKGELGRWKQRIIDYAKIESDDLATFPYFGQFIQKLCVTQSKFCFDLINNNSKDIQNFLPAFFHGLILTDKKHQALELIENWAEESNFLPHILQFIQYTTNLPIQILKIILIKSNNLEENIKRGVLARIMTIAVKFSDENNKQLMKDFFFPALEEISKLNDGWCWVNNIWFESEKLQIFADMANTQVQAIVDSLVKAPDIDYHITDILIPIAKEFPEMILDLFCKRIQYKNQSDITSDRYEAVPFDGLRKLSEPLSKDANLVLEKVISTYNRHENYLFEHQGGRLVHHIFPKFSNDLEQVLISYVHRETSYWLAITKILKLYHGRTPTHNVFKELVKVISLDNKTLVSELTIALKQEGVVDGEFGFVEAYKKKAESVTSWLDDENSKVREFAQRFIDLMQKDADREEKKVTENQTLRKHRFGSNLTDKE